MLATTRSAWGGSIVRLVTKATAFSFQSVMTSAEAGPASAVKITAGTTQRTFFSMAISVVSEKVNARVDRDTVRAGLADACPSQVGQCRRGDGMLAGLRDEINGAKGNRLLQNLK